MTDTHAWTAEPVERRQLAREILDRHLEYTDGLSRGQVMTKTSHALAAIEEALSLPPTDAQIRQMAERFLAWPLPEDFFPDNGISVKRPNYAPNVHWQPTGTNLFSYAQAETMVRFMVRGNQ